MTKRGRSPLKVAAVAPNWLGDAVMSLTMIARMRGVEGVSLVVVARPYTSRVFAGVVDELVVSGGSGRRDRVWRQARALRAVGVDGVVVLPPSFSSALGAWLARVPIRVGHATDARSVLLTDALPPARRGSEHLSASYETLAGRAWERLLGPTATLAAGAPPSLRVFDEDEAEAAALRGRLSVPAGRYAALVPGAAYGPAKSWTWERFREAARVLSRDLPVVLMGGGGERQLCGRVAEGLSGVYNAAGLTSMGGFFALLAGSGVLVANDSGSPHAAAALGVPVVVLFGSTSPAWTRPLGGDVAVIHHPVHCAPCFRRTCPTALECYAAIPVDEVVAAARRALEEGTKKEVAQTPRGR